MAKELELSLSDKEITPCGGMALMGRMLQKIRFNEASREIKQPVQYARKYYTGLLAA